jgi:putative two-component system response regulator
MNHNLNVLIIDDDYIARKLIKILLRECTVWEAENGLLGLNLLQQTEDIDVVILDLNMPVMDGYEFLEKYPTWDANKKQPKLYVSSCTDKSTFLKNAALQGIDLSIIDDYFEKPFDVNKLRKLLSLTE